MNAIDHEASLRLDWLDYQLGVILSLSLQAQEALAEHIERIYRERSAILKEQPVEARQPAEQAA